MGFCACIGKTSISILNAILLAISIVCIGVGAYGFGAGYFKQSNYALGLFAGLIALGCVIFITAVVGFVGICQNKAGALTCYLVFIVTCLILAAALAGFFTWVYITYKNDPSSVLQTAWDNTPQDVLSEFEKLNNCLGFNQVEGSTLPPCGPILIDLYNRYATIAMIVIWVVFGVLLLATIITCMVRADVESDWNKQMNQPRTVYQADPAYKV